MIGVNISGGEYKESGIAERRDCILPLNAGIDYYAGEGVDVIRVPVQWEYLQKTENGALNREEIARLEAGADRMTGSTGNDTVPENQRVS